MPIATSILKADEARLRAIYERRSRKALVNVVLNAKFHKKTDMPLAELLQMNLETMLFVDIVKALQIYNKNRKGQK